MRTPSRLTTEDATLNRVQDNILGALADIQGALILDGVLTDAVTLSASYQDIPHRLARLPRGWILVSPAGAGAVEEDSTQTTPRASYLRVRSSGAMTCRFWVF